MENRNNRVRAQKPARIRKNKLSIDRIIKERKPFIVIEGYSAEDIENKIMRVLSIKAEYDNGLSVLPIVELYERSGPLMAVGDGTNITYIQGFTKTIKDRRIKKLFVNNNPININAAIAPQSYLYDEDDDEDDQEDECECLDRGYRTYGSEPYCTGECENY